MIKKKLTDLQYFVTQARFSQNLTEVIIKICLSHKGTEVKKTKENELIAHAHLCEESDVDPLRLPRPLAFDIDLVEL